LPATGNPDPRRWTLIAKEEFKNGYVLRVRYPDCTNFEGQKVLVYRGRFSPRLQLDPHFYDSDDAPVARFRPDADGWRAACALAASMGKNCMIDTIATRIVEPPVFNTHL